MTTALIARMVHISDANLAFLQSQPDALYSELATAYHECCKWNARLLVAQRSNNGVCRSPR